MQVDMLTVAITHVAHQYPRRIASPSCKSASTWHASDSLEVRCRFVQDISQLVFCYKVNAPMGAKMSPVGI